MLTYRIVAIEDSFGVFINGILDVRLFESCVQDIVTSTLLFPSQSSTNHGVLVSVFSLGEVVTCMSIMKIEVTYLH